MQASASSTTEQIMDSGPIVRYGPNRISMNTATALHDIYGSHANTRKSQYYAIWTKFFKREMSMATIDRKKHAFKRNITVRGINNASVKVLEEVIVKHTRRLCEHLVDEDAGWGAARDMTRWVAWCMSDIMGDTTFSRNWNMMEDPKNRQIPEILRTGLAHMPWMIHLRFAFPGLVKNANKYEALSKEQSDWRIAQTVKHGDIFEALLEAKDLEKGSRLSYEDIISEAALLIIAGSDTMSTAISSTIFYLLHYPSTHEILKLKFEVSSPVSRTSNPGRGVGGLLPRETLEGGLVADGVYFPAGIDMGVPHYALHHNSLFHDEPFEFLPERWLVASPGSTQSGRSEAEVAKTRSAYCPFSYGRTSCVGKSLSYLEMGVVLARIIWSYDMRIKPDSTLGEGSDSLGHMRWRRKEFQTWDSFVSLHEGPMVQFKRRQ
ncbi:hypothetical protein NHQ30_001510 [Ciborinia camelliae]|nr:hypothetical protein NHQ30_001510 [Ciborinia camelliae]